MKMTRIWALAGLLTGLVVGLAGCTTATDSNWPGLAPIPGSITYGGQPRTKLTKSPIGSQVPHDFRDANGNHVYETYIIQPDRSLKLVERHVVEDRLWD